jgi:prophage antirepressor
MENVLAIQNEIKDTFTSLELVDLINQFRKQEGNEKELLHKNLLQVIRDEFDREINELKIQPVNYKDKKGEKRTMYSLNLKQSRRVLLRESKFVRCAVIEYIDKLENKLQEVLMPQTYIQALERLLESEKEKERLRIANIRLENKIEEDKPKVSYYDTILQSKDTLPISVIAKDYGMSGKKLNALLKDLKIQYKQGDIWLLYQKYADCGYTQTTTVKIKHTNGDDGSRTHTKWTQKGRIFLYNLLKQQNILPTIEQKENGELIDDSNN